MKSKTFTKVLACALAIICLTGFNAGCRKKVVPPDGTDEKEIMMYNFEQWAPDFQLCRISNVFGRVSRNADPQFVKGGKYSAKVEPSGAGWAYFPTYSDLFDFDYQDFTSIEFVRVDMYNAQGAGAVARVAIVTTITTVDAILKSNETRFTLQSGWNTLDLDLGEGIMGGTGDLKSIKGVYFWFEVADASSAPVYYMDNIRLVPKKPEQEDANTYIVVPTYEGAAKVGAEITIPDAKVYFLGTNTGNYANVTAVYTDAADGEKTTVSGKTFTPKYLGALKITYSYADAVSRVLRIPVAERKDPPNGYAFNINKDTLGLLTQNAQWEINYVDKPAGDIDGYISWKAVNDMELEWQNLNIVDPSLKNHINRQQMLFTHLHVRVYFASPEPDDRNTLLLFFNYNTWQLYRDYYGGVNKDDEEYYNKKLGIGRMGYNQWYDVYIPQSVINVGQYLFALRFNEIPGDHYPNVQEFRFTSMKFVNRAANAPIILNSAGEAMWWWPALPPAPVA